MGAERIWFHPNAVEEAHAAYQWYHERNPEIAEAFVTEIDRSIELIAAGPNQWASYVVGTRRLAMRRFPYLIVYREVGGTVQVLAVAHARRRPGYWRRRNS